MTKLNRFLALLLAHALLLASTGSEAFAAARQIRVVTSGGAPLAAPLRVVPDELGILRRAGRAGIVEAGGIAPASGRMAELSARAGLENSAVRPLPAGVVPLSRAPLTPAAAVRTLAAPSASVLPVRPAAELPLDPAALTAESIVPEATPRLAPGAARVRGSLIGLERAFSGKKDAGGTPSSSAPSSPEVSGAAAKLGAAHDGADPSLAPPAPAGASAPAAKAPVPAPASGGGGGKDGGGESRDDAGGKGWFGLGKAAVMFIAALLVAQVGVEALGNTMPPLAQKTFGTFTVVAQLAIFSSIASIIGRQIGPVFIKKYGLRKVYLSSTLMRLLSISAMVALIALGPGLGISAAMILNLMMGFYSINGLLGGVAMTAEQSIPPALVGSDQAKIEKFWTWEQTLLEIVGVTGPIVAGMVVAGFGFMPTLIAFPISFAIALAMLFFTLRIPKRVEQLRLAELAQEAKQAQLRGAGPKGLGSAFKDFFARVGHGAKLVWQNPLLRASFLGYTAFMLLNPFLYAMLGPGYALRLVGEANAELAASVGGWLTGFYSLGGLIGGVLMIVEQKRLDRRIGKEPAKYEPGSEETAGRETEAWKQWKAQSDAALRASMLKWMKWGTVGLLAIFTLAFPSPLFLGTLTLPALALIPFGIAQVISFVKLKSFFQAKVPQGEMADAMGFFGSASLAVSTLGLLGLKYLFKGFGGFTPFWIVAGLMIPLAVYYVVLTRQLAKASKPVDPA